MKLQKLQCAVIAVASLFSIQTAFSQAPKPIYDTSGKGLLQIMHAVNQASSENKRVLIQFGGDWCGWCVLLHKVCETDPVISATLKKHFVAVYVDSHTNPETMKTYAPEVPVVPYLVVLDSSGNILANQASDAFQVGSGHEIENINAWLNEWGTKPVDAKMVLSTAQMHAAKSDKNVLLAFGAPWCGWCRKLEAVLHSDVVAPVIFKNFVVVKIDLESMQNAEVVEAKYRKAIAVAPNTAPENAKGNLLAFEGGIPWFAMLDSKGTVLATSDCPNYGNIGFPAEDQEISWFNEMLKKSAKHITNDDLALLAKTFKEAIKPKN